MGYRQVNISYFLCDNCNDAVIVNLIVQSLVTETNQLETFLNENTKLLFVWLDKMLFTHSKYKLNDNPQQKVSMQAKMCVR